MFEKLDLSSVADTLMERAKIFSFFFLNLQELMKL